MRLQNAANSLSNSATFHKLVGVNSQSAALPFIMVDWLGDIDLDSDFLTFPRALVRHAGPQLANREGTDTFLGQGQMLIFVQYTFPSDAQLAAWYSISGPFTETDQRQHMNNLFGSISDDLYQLATTPGCLEYQRLEEFSCGFTDPITENGQQIVELVYILHREALP